MIGLSLSYQWLCAAAMGASEHHALLLHLWEEGVRSIEIRPVPLSAAPTDVLRVCNLLWDQGYFVTIHGQCTSAESAVDEVFAPLEYVLLHMRQHALTVTLHPIPRDNAQMLRSLSDWILQNGYPVRIALENERRMPDGTPGDSLAFVLDTVSAVDRDNVGICFDMGHFAWCTEHLEGDAMRLPPYDFFKRVIHTHIHVSSENNTHYPLEAWCEPYSSYMRMLDYKYFGVYNLELSAERFAHRMNAVDGYVCSVRTLKKHYPFSASLYDALRFHYDDSFHRACEVLRRTDGCYAAFIGSSSYLFSTNGYRWAMDVSFRDIRHLAQAPEHIRETLGCLELMMITHGHDDHMEEATICVLAESEATFLAPLEVADDMLRFGVRKEKLIAVKAGDTVCIGPLCISVLAGRHFRPETGVGIASVGYRVAAEGAPTLAFPGDVRDYRTEALDASDAEYCFAHVWLSDDAASEECYMPKCEEFADFMLGISRKNIFLTHLYEHGRTAGSMWQMHHARAAAAAILARSPETSVCVPACGEIVRL